MGSHRQHLGRLGPSAPREPHLSTACAHWRHLDCALPECCCACHGYLDDDGDDDSEG